MKDRYWHSAQSVFTEPWKVIWMPYLMTIRQATKVGSLPDCTICIITTTIVTTVKTFSRHPRHRRLL